jgi:multidrug efflux system membrane fusion protein
MRITLKSALVFLFATLLVSSCARKSAHQSGHGKRDGNEGPVPVTVAEAKRQDVPIYLDGLGTVQAFNTATVRAQVSGRLVAVPFKEGDEVRAGDVIARVDPRTYQATLDQAIAKKGQDQAQLAGARLDLKRYLDLVPEGYVTQQQADQQRALVAQYEAAVQADEAAIENDQVQLSYCTITAPFAGVLGIRQVDVGNLVSASDQTGIVVITQIKPIAVIFTLPEQALSVIRGNADPQGLTVIALDRNNQAQLAQGRLSAFDNQIDQSTGTIKLKATFANVDRKLWPGQFVNVRLLASVRKNGLVVPAQAVQRGPDGAFVYVAKPDNTVEMRPLTVAQSEEGLALVDKGVQAGERVVVDGQYRLQPGSKIQIVPSAGAVNGAATGAPGADE